MFEITSLYMTVDMGGAGTADDADSIMICSVCFDVEEEDGEVEEGTDGVGSCFYWDVDNMYIDAEYAGAIEALGSDSFKFNEPKNNNWD